MQSRPVTTINAAQDTQISHFQDGKERQTGKQTVEKLASLGRAEASEGLEEGGLLQVGGLTQSKIGMWQMSEQKPARFDPDDKVINNDVDKSPPGQFFVVYRRLSVRCLQCCQKRFLQRLNDEGRFLVHFFHGGFS